MNEPDRTPGPAVELEAVAVAFRGPVLRQLTLRVSPGTAYGLIGPAATGKSVVLKLVAGLLEPDAGAVRIAGRAHRDRSADELLALRRDMGMLFQSYALFDWLTVRENVAFPLRRLTQLSEAAILARADERLARVGLSPFAERSVEALSGGQKKRVGVARATVTHAALVLYDEPTAGLDPVTSQRIMELLRAEQLARGATTLIVSSDLKRLFSAVDRVGVLLGGELVWEGPPEAAASAEDARVRQFVQGALEGPL